MMLMVSFKEMNSMEDLHICCISCQKFSNRCIYITANVRNMNKMITFM